MGWSVSFRSKMACLIDEDILAFSAILQAEYPSALYFEDSSWSDPENKKDMPPNLALYKSLWEIEESRRPFDLYMTLDMDWVPSFTWCNKLKYWNLDSPELPKVRFLMGRVWPAQHNQAEHLKTTSIEVSCRSDNKEDFAFARRLFRLLGKVASNRNQIVVSYPTYEIIRTQEKGGDVMVGKAAREWCMADASRLFCMADAMHWGIRPLVEK